MRTFRLLSARRLRQQPLKAAIAVIAVAAGVALAVAVLVTITSVERSVLDFGRSLAGPAPLRVVGATGRGGLTADAIAAAEAVEGVEAVVPVVQAISIADGREVADGVVRTDTSGHDVLVLGVDCRAAALFGADDCDPARFEAAGDGVVAVGPALADALGGLDGASLRSEAGRIPLDGVPVLDDLAGVAGGLVAVQSIEGAQQRFLQGDELDVAYVLPEAGADLDALEASLEAAVGEQNGVLARDDPPPQIGTVLIVFVPLFSLLALFGLGTGAVLVRNTLVLSIEERRRQLAVLGALGADGRTVLGGLLGEAALLGLVGGALGTAGGALLAGPIVDSLSQVTRSVAGIPVQRHVSPSTIAIGVLLGGAVAAATAVLPARRALRLDVAGELSGRTRLEEGRAPALVRRAVVAGVLAAGALGLCWASARGGGLDPWQASVGPLGVVAVAIALLVGSSSLGPLLLGRLARRAPRTGRPSFILGVANLVRDPRRAGALVTAIAAPVVVAFVADGVERSARGSVEALVAANGGGVSVSTTAPGEGAGAYLGAEALEALGRLPGVAAAEAAAFLVLGAEAGDLVAVQAFDGEITLANEVLDGTADLDRFHAGEVLVGPGLARTSGVRAGGTVRLPTATGHVELPVQGVWEDGEFGGHSVFVPHDVLVEHWGPQPVSFVRLRPDPGTTEEELAATVRAAADGIDPALQVRTSAELTDDIGDSIAQEMLPFRVLQRGLLFVAFVAVLSTLLLAGYQRRREHGLLAAVGAAPPEVMRAVGAEAGIVSGVSLLLAAATGPIVLWALLQVLPLLIGFRDEMRPDWWSLVAAGATSVAVAMAAAAWPAWRAGRVDVLDALRYE
jgi:putative ABC transport system permease protein